MIRIAVVEDEQNYIDQITEYLRRYEKEQREELQISVYRDGDGITAEYKAQFDIIFMDIQMKFVDGMTAAEEIRKKGYRSNYYIYNEYDAVCYSGI